MRYDLSDNNHHYDNVLLQLKIDYSENVGCLKLYQDKSLLKSNIIKKDIFHTTNIAGYTFYFHSVHIPVIWWNIEMYSIDFYIGGDRSAENTIIQYPTYELYYDENVLYNIIMDHIEEIFYALGLFFGTQLGFDYNCTSSELTVFKNNMSVINF